MVFYTCSGCGESLKKNKVEKHVYACRGGCEYLTCIDCSRDFYGDDYKTHTACITEDQKYSAKGTEFKPNKGDVKQQKWLENIESILSDPDAKLSLKAKDLIKNLKNCDNIPRKRPKFLNFVKNSLRIYDPKLGEEVWEAFSAASSKTDDNNNGKVRSNADIKTSHTNGDNANGFTNSKETTKKGESTEKADYEITSKKSKKKKRKSQVAVDDTANGEASSLEDPPKKKKKKSKTKDKTENGENIDTDHTKGGAETADSAKNGGDNLEVSFKKDKKKKKRKLEISENGINDPGKPDISIPDNIPRKKIKRIKSKEQNANDEISGAKNNGISIMTSSDENSNTKKNGVEHAITDSKIKQKQTDKNKNKKRRKEKTENASLDNEDIPKTKKSKLSDGGTLDSTSIKAVNNDEMIVKTKKKKKPKIENE